MHYTRYIVSKSFRFTRYSILYTLSVLLEVLEIGTVADGPATDLVLGELRQDGLARGLVSNLEVTRRKATGGLPDHQTHFVPHILR